MAISVTPGGSLLLKAMKHYRSIIVGIAMGVFTMVMGLSPALAYSRAPHLSASAFILVDGATGQVLAGQHVRSEFYPASITKIMTAYLAITRGWHKTVMVSRQAELQPGSSAYLLAGQRLPMPKVVTAMMLVSGNDAAYAVAQTVAGSVPAFVRMMNAQARAWGAPGIHFANPDGLPNPHHVVSALGMAIIAEHAMKNPIFARIVDTKKSTLPPDPHPRVYYNQNRLLYDYPGAVGIKIGYTIEADETIVTAARRHGLFLIGVLLHDTPQGLWPDARNLLTWGFSHFQTRTLIKRGQSLGVVLVGSRKVPVMASRTVVYAVPRGAPSRVRWSLVATHPKSRGLIKSGAPVGLAQVRLAGRPIGQISIRSMRRIKALPPAVSHHWWWLMLPVGVGVALALPRKRVLKGLQRGVSRA